MSNAAASKTRFSELLTLYRIAARRPLTTLTGMESGTITQSHVDALLAASEILTETKFGKLTVVTVVLPSGFILVESSGCVDPANYRQETGRAIAWILDRSKGRK